jgi:hypothetical protein
MAMRRESDVPGTEWNPLAPEKATLLTAVPAAELRSLRKERDDLRSENAILRSELSHLRNLASLPPVGGDDDGFSVGPC